ncbi:McrC family protein [Amycolatopsis sp. H20-H5]|uniref:McrC family protein n=1 Tax=Amycolatopsis sp. H20-H5 TaxID=3046309 RepID=UPI002DB9F1B4|nr:restriction endonuclease [Amycolatopsis sp. H20-H5]MEC3977954.1 restriction endonuclease [Amycolatopsis sp. H20-H5]
MIPIEVSETGETTHSLTDAQVDALTASGMVTLTHLRRSGGKWTIKGKRGRVGVFRAGDLQVLLLPKLDVSRLLFLAGYARNANDWLDEPATVTVAAGIVPAVAHILWRQADQALRLGLLQGYVTVDEASMTLRGKVRQSDQMRKHYSQALPLEIRYDEFSVDVPENRILLAAVLRVLAMPDLDVNARGNLDTIRRRLRDVTPPIAGAPLPSWQANRLNERYHAALRLSEVILESSSPEHGKGNLLVNGFVFNLEKLFEDYVTKALTHALQERSEGRGYPQYRWHLAQGEKLPMKPDLVWKKQGLPHLVFDAKYKNGRSADNFYQMLGYCVALGVKQGHLVYAKGQNELDRYVTQTGSVELFAHSLDLMAPLPELRTQINHIADLALSAARP